MATQSQKARFGSTLKRLRADRQLSQRDVVHLLAQQDVIITQQSYADWELGRSLPQHRAKVFALEDALGADGQLLAILGYSSSHSDADDSAAVGVRDELRALRERLDRLEESRSARSGRSSGSRARRD